MNMVSVLKETENDFEWYPTTPSIIAKIKQYCHMGAHDSVLDCGAGDGRVLDALTDGEKYAIEKAVPLIQAMSPEIIIVGTDFHQSTLIDKRVDVVFCNPPYSEFEFWATKIIREAYASKIFLVIPTRWKQSQSINDAIKRRSANVDEIGTFDFHNAERQARAVVSVLKISLKGDGYRDEAPDPFNHWFDSEFDFQEAADRDPDAEIDNGLKSSLHSKLEKAVVAGRGKVPALVELYNHEMANLYENFKKISSLDADLLRELGTSAANLRAALKQRIKGLKNRYWEELFNNLDDITSRLTVKSRESMVKKLNGQTNVDFTESNIYAVLIWAIKNANRYYDQQLVDTVESLVEQANVANYKSNQRVYQWDQWRYNRRDQKDYITHYGLELRIVLERHCGIMHEGSWSTWDFQNNLHKSAHDTINDLITIANNLNFRTLPNHNTRSVGDWESNKTKEFYDTDGGTLMFVKAFKNGNLHIKFNQKFIMRLNVEFGRLKGWLKDKHQAADELKIPVSEAAASFNANRQITMSSVKLLEA